MILEPGRPYLYVLWRPFLVFLMAPETFLSVKYKIENVFKNPLNPDVKAQNLHKTYILAP